MRKFNIKPLVTVSVLFLAVVAAGCGVCRSLERVSRVEHVALKDSDGDGVMDDQDKCADTPTGFAVNAEGCIVEQTVVLRTVNFEYDSHRLTSPSRSTLDQVALALIKQPTLSVQVGGHTDSVGSAQYNTALSQKRAESVRQYLIRKGVDAGNLLATGFGESKPIASNDTADGRTENRRVDFAIVDNPEHLNVLRGASTEKSKAAARR